MRDQYGKGLFALSRSIVAPVSLGFCFVSESAGSVL